MDIYSILKMKSNFKLSKCLELLNYAFCFKRRSLEAIKRQRDYQFYQSYDEIKKELDVIRLFR
jgi:hypothetical protein